MDLIRFTVPVLIKEVRVVPKEQRVLINDLERIG